MRRYFAVLVLLIFLPSSSLFAQPEWAPRVLLVTAHSDDETAAAATIYKITHDLKGTVDLALMTNGEGGYKYSTLGNDLYHLELTNEAIGRKYLPTIRKRELMNAGKILGIHDYFFFDQTDHRYTVDIHEAFTGIWDTTLVLRRLGDILRTGKYDFVFTMLPTDSTHGHHKGAGVLALKAVAVLPISERPVVLGMSGANKGADLTDKGYSGLPEFPLTHVDATAPIFTFDRTQKFGYRNILDYKIIVNWEIAEHKSQGTMQLGVNGNDLEVFRYFALNPPTGIDKTRRLFDLLAINRYPELDYPNARPPAGR